MTAEAGPGYGLGRLRLLAPGERWRPGDPATSAWERRGERSGTMATTITQPAAIAVSVSDAWLFDGIDGAARIVSDFAYEVALEQALRAVYPAAYVAVRVQQQQTGHWVGVTIDLPAGRERADWAEVAQAAATLAAAVAADTDRWLIADEPPVEPRTAE